jgi:hypothetical protein
MNQQADLEMYEAMLASGNYTVIGTAGSVVLLERSSPLSPAFLASTTGQQQVKKYSFPNEIGSWQGRRPAGMSIWHEVMELTTPC